MLLFALFLTGLGIDIVVIPGTPRDSPVPWEHKPKIIRKPEDLQICETQNATFEFELENSEGVTLRWTKEGKPLLEGGRVKTSQDQNVIKLLIINAEVGDEALYECHISNEAGEIRCEMQLLVDGKCFISCWFNGSSFKAPSFSIVFLAA